MHIFTAPIFFTDSRGSRRFGTPLPLPKGLPTLAPAAEAESVPPMGRAPSSAGLIVITGPPASGKQVLGHYLSEYMHNAVHVSQTDPVVAAARDEDPRPLAALRERIRGQLRCGRKVAFSARLANPTMRERTLEVATEVGVPALLVDVRGTDPDALIRFGEAARERGRTGELLAELQRVVAKYHEVTPREKERVPALTVPADQTVEDQVKTVLDGWKGMGAID